MGQGEWEGEMKAPGKGTCSLGADTKREKNGGQAYHIDELSNGQPKAHDHHIRGVGHWPCPAVVAPKEVFEELVLSLGMRGLLC